MNNKTFIVPIEGQPDLVRDVASMAVINTNSKALLEAKRKKRVHLENKRRIEILESNVEDIKTVLGRLELMFQEFVKGRE